MQPTALLWLAVAASVLSASNVSCADYAWTSTPYLVYETVQFGGGEFKTTVRKQPTEVAKIFRLIMEKGQNKDPLKLAETIVFNSKRPLLMAAMGLHESNFREKAKSKCGATGIWQLMPEWHWPGYSPFNNHKNLEKAEEVLEIKTKEAGGNLKKGVERYNGAGPQAVEYSDDVWKTYEELKKQKA